MTEILKCPMCGSSAKVYATGCSESYGYAWQYYGVDCADEFNSHCDMSVGISADFSYINANNDLVIELWNKVACLKQ